ncbi:hypothetical protein [Chitinimonas sp. BJB300]|uniref:hypothetical protein n=1 Tax=Chitinimonas sp. BJB300 TaxID=1559339 RepID=UPI000C0CE4F2|nr:hypothetical protein [Chitinimonas sp. BJB300]PHV09849.1 hypothetical protein CSQ89_19405 [Chitinimonas sp. BJB300]TSJ84949.1 hypothetical protein FG002_018500 [Chitinimonas sp. BJB300]
MDKTFKADAEFQRLIHYLAKQLLPAIMVIFANLLFGVPLWISASIAGIVSLIAAISFTTRFRWGDELVFSSDSLTIFKKKNRYFCISMQNIIDYEIRNDVIVISWNEGEKKRVLLIGAERFSPETWQGIVSAMSFTFNRPNVQVAEVQ